MEKKRKTTSSKKDTLLKKKTKTITKKKTLKNKPKKKAFTLIELLAVIIILGILMIIAIPSVTTYISNSRKKAYISDANAYIQAATILVNKGDIDVYNPDISYFIPGECLKTETGDTSPYGDWKTRYVGVIYTGEGYKYYWTSTDTSKMGIDLTSQQELDSDLIQPDIDEVTPKVIDGRTIVKVLNKTDCQTWETPSNVVIDQPTSNGIKIGNNEWKYGDLAIKIVEDTQNCWQENDKYGCNAEFIIENKGTKTLLGWRATITFEDDIELTYNNQFSGFANVTKNGNTYTFDAISHHYTNIEGGDSISRAGLGLHVKTKGSNLLKEADFDYEYLITDGDNNPTDFSIDSHNVNYHFERTKNCEDYSGDSQVDFQCDYKLTITNNSSAAIKAKIKLIPDATVIKLLNTSGYPTVNNKDGSITVNLFYWDGDVVAANGGTKTINLIKFGTKSQNAKPNITTE